MNWILNITSSTPVDRDPEKAPLDESIKNGVTQMSDAIFSDNRD